MVESWAHNCQNLSLNPGDGRIPLCVWAPPVHSSSWHKQPSLWGGALILTCFWWSMPSCNWWKQVSNPTAFTSEHVMWRKTAYIGCTGGRKVWTKRCVYGGLLIILCVLRHTNFINMIFQWDTCSTLELSGLCLSGTKFTAVYDLSVTTLVYQTNIRILPLIISHIFLLPVQLRWHPHSGSHWLTTSLTCATDRLTISRKCLMTFYAELSNTRISKILELSPVWINASTG